MSRRMTGDFDDLSVPQYVQLHFAGQRIGVADRQQE
jgi:hypothetical protein